MMIADSKPSRTARVLILVGGGILALILSVQAVGMLREQLHVGCSFGTMGEATGSWMCTDGIGYLFPGLALLFGSGLSLLIGVFVVLGARLERTRRRALTVLAFAPLLWSLGWLSSVTLARTDPLPDGETWPGVWLIAVGISALLALAGAALAASAPPLRGGAAYLLWLTGGALLVAASIVQPGLALATVPTAALLAAARLVPLLTRDESTDGLRDRFSAG
ncbi:hypothetical protein DC31_00630 [Microbacterium sp. CH12i]|uniref:hypothetical protein n=1 Tax=Microbacterium sp. CH12i TaxID=1479651 RepID=UPI000460ABA0|nr:hypothetical protein [Microbacterium sp. CH12i]KDA07206.1 hypothetical protein DC31_00630 [Microbacterium sp. CH12i]